MRTKFWRYFLPVGLIAAGLSGAAFVSGLSGPRTETKVNLAAVADVYGSFASGSEAAAALNDDVDPADSRDRSHGVYFVWGENETQWVEYEWSRPVAANGFAVYFWADGRRVSPPESCRLLYWDGQAFVPVSGGEIARPEADKYNLASFEEVRTSRLRLEFKPGPPGAAGILEWKVFDSGASPDFPPRVEAGVDRVAVKGGRTWLSGSIRTLKKPGSPIPSLTWRKKSGPGPVAFENPHAADTTATLPEEGTYILEITAEQGQLAGSSTLSVTVEAPPPPVPLEPVATGFYRIDSPLWSRRAKAQIVNWIPHCIDKISDPDLKEGGLNNLIDAAAKLAGKPHGRHRGYVFSNAWVFNTVEAMCIALRVDPGGDKDIIAAQERMRAVLEEWIPLILAAQEPDGYFQTAFTLPRERAQDETPLEHWSRRGDHEGYVAGYFLEAGIAHHRTTGGKDLRLFNAARKLADCWYDNIGPAPKKEWYCGHQAMEIALVRFGRYIDEVEGGGQGKKYIGLAKYLLDTRKDGSEYDQSHVPVVQQYEAVGHAVRAAYSYAGMADIALETGDIDYTSAVKSLWDNIVHRKYYVTGGVGSGETSEGFGPDYSLRNQAYCESCSSCGEIFFQHKMNRLTHDAACADLYEATLYNALLGSMDLEGRNFFYQNPLEARRPRSDWHVCPCCVGNIPRTLLSLPTWMYLKDSKGLYVNLFIGSTVTIEDVAGTPVELVQETAYPWSGDVTLTVSPVASREFSVRIRAPRRDVSRLYSARPEADGIISISLNGSPIAPPIENGYAVITRTWEKGDRIEVSLPMTVQRIKADERIKADIGRTALRFGPLIYSLERVDQDLEPALSPNAPLTPEWQSDFLEGVTVIRGAWADGSPLLAIPNYARANRDPEEKPDPKADPRARRLPPVKSIVWIKEK